jgi:hypothetical protein
MGRGYEPLSTEDWNKLMRSNVVARVFPKGMAVPGLGGQEFIETSPEPSPTPTPTPNSYPVVFVSSGDTFDDICSNPQPIPTLYSPQPFFTNEQQLYYDSALTQFIDWSDDNNSFFASTGGTQLYFYGFAPSGLGTYGFTCPSPTPTPSITPTITPTPTLTPTSTLTPTPTITPTSTPGSSIEFVSQALNTGTSSSYTFSNVSYGGAGLILIAIISNGNTGISGIPTLNGVLTTKVREYNCSNTNRVSLLQVRLTGGTSGDFVINYGASVAGMEAQIFRITNNISDTNVQNTTICQASGTPTFTLTSLPSNSLIVYAMRNTNLTCGLTNTGIGYYGTFYATKRTAAGTFACAAAEVGAIATGIAYAYN